jgi:hypothetical protein
MVNLWSVRNESRHERNRYPSCMRSKSTWGPKYWGKTIIICKISSLSCIHWSCGCPESYQRLGSSLPSPASVLLTMDPNQRGWWPKWWTRRCFKRDLRSYRAAIFDCVIEYETVSATRIKLPTSTILCIIPPPNALRPPFCSNSDI